MKNIQADKSGDGFIDRSKVRILLCDNNKKSSEEVFTLLCKCSYQVISARSPRQVIDALNSEGPDIDIILSEVDLPMSKGLKMLKNIMRDKDLRRIPVIMMSAEDEVSIVVKCLKFGAADYLVKPLRTNELLNLWTHVWRRRRMLGLAEKSIVIYDLDLIASDPSDANSNSTTLFSDDSDDKSQKSNKHEMCVSFLREDEIHATTATTPVEATVWASSECEPDDSKINDKEAGKTSSFQKNELKIGNSSAFFTYVKLNTPSSKKPVLPYIGESATQNLNIVENLSVIGQVATNIQEENNVKIPESHPHGDVYGSRTRIQDPFPAERSCARISVDSSQQMNSHELFSEALMHSRNSPRSDINSCYMPAAGPYYMPGLMNQVTMPHTSMSQKFPPDMHNHATSAVLSQCNHIPQGTLHLPGMTSYPFFPFGICLQPGQTPAPAPHPWPSYGNALKEQKPSKVDRREAALMKFRQKRKERCFDKKIRYVNRKRLAECRPRLRGQFVRKVNGIAVDLNGHPASAEEEDDEEEDEEYEDEDDV